MSDIPPPSAIRDVYLFVRDGDRLLLLLRSGTGYKDGEWGPPSGKVEADESYTEAAIRELAEETGIAIAPADLHFVHAIERQSADEPSWVGMFFEVTTTATPENREPHKHAAVEWFPIDALPDNTVGYAVHVLTAIAAGQQFSQWRE